MNMIINNKHLVFIVPRCVCAFVYSPQSSKGAKQKRVKQELKSYIDLMCVHYSCNNNGCNVYSMYVSLHALFRSLSSTRRTGAKGVRARCA